MNLLNEYFAIFIKDWKIRVNNCVKKTVKCNKLKKTFLSLITSNINSHKNN